MHPTVPLFAALALALTTTARADGPTLKTNWTAERHGDTVLVTLSVSPTADAVSVQVQSPRGGAVVALEGLDLNVLLEEQRDRAMMSRAGSWASWERVEPGDSLVVGSWSFPATADQTEIPLAGVLPTEGGNVDLSVTLPHRSAELVMDLRTALLNDAVADLIDEEGRPLGEQATTAFPADTRLAACPYHDRRRGHPMNLDALAQMARHWSAVLAALACDGTVYGAWRATVAGLVAPVRFAAANPGEPVPVQMAAIYKACVGLNQVLVHLMLTRNVGAAHLADLGAPADFFAWLDAGAFLVGADQVCAGPRRLVEQAFVAMCARGDNAPDPVVDTACATLRDLVAQAIEARPDRGPAWMRAVVLAHHVPAHAGRIAA